jgi:hypothetical protein
MIEFTVSGNLANEQLVDKAVGVDVFPSTTTDVDPPVTEFGARSCPEPTAARPILDFRAETFKNRLGLDPCSHGPVLSAATDTPSRLIRVQVDALPHLQCFGECSGHLPICKVIGRSYFKSLAIDPDQGDHPRGKVRCLVGLRYGHLRRQSIHTTTRQTPMVMPRKRSIVTSWE